MVNKEDMTKIGAGVLSGLVVFTGGFATSAWMDKSDFDSMSTQIAELTQDLSTTMELNKGLIVENALLTEEVADLMNVTPEVVTEIVEIPVEVEVEVESPINTLLVDWIEDEMDWDREDVISYVQFELDAEILAEEYLRDNWYDILDDEDMFDINELEDYRKSELRLQKVYEDPEVLDIDHDDEEATYLFEIKVRGKEDGEDSTTVRFFVELEVNGNEVFVEDVEVAE